MRPLTRTQPASIHSSDSLRDAMARSDITLDRRTPSAVPGTSPRGIALGGFGLGRASRNALEGGPSCVVGAVPAGLRVRGGALPRTVGRWGSRGGESGFSPRRGRSFMRPLDHGRVYDGHRAGRCESTSAGQLHRVPAAHALMVTCLVLRVLNRHRALTEDHAFRLGGVPRSSTARGSP